MEGISHEACSLAGTLGPRQADPALRRQRHLDRRPSRAGSPTTRPRRFEAYGWHVIPTSTATTSKPWTPRSRQRRPSTDRPTLICCKTVIGKGAPNKAGTAEAHGAALGEKEVAATRVALGWTHPAVRDPARDLRRWDARARGAAAARRLGRALRRVPRARSRNSPPNSPAACAASCRPTGRDIATAFIAAQVAKGETIATRKASQQAIEALAPGAAGIPRRLRRPHRQRVHQLVAAARRSTRTRSPATTSTTACASSAWAPSPTASRCTAASSPSSARSSPSPTTRATRCAWRR